VVVYVIDPGVADVTGHQGVALSGYLPGEPYGPAVEFLQFTLSTNGRQLFSVGIISQGDHDFGAGSEEFTVEFPYSLWEIHDHFGDIGPGLDIPPPFQHKDITFCP
jgi:hypothetical protein